MATAAQIAAAKAAQDAKDAALAKTLGIGNSGFQDFSAGGKAPESWSSASAAIFNATNLPGLAQLGVSVTGQNLLQGAVQLSVHNPGAFGQLKSLLMHSNAYGNLTSKQSAGILGNHVWNAKTDEAAFKSFLGTQNLLAVPAATGVTRIAPDLGGALASNKTNNAASGNTYITNRLILPPAVVRAPATADLDAIAQKAFSTTLGRNATPAESALFTKQFQDLALSIGNSKNASKKLNTFAPVADPTSLLPVGQKPLPVVGQVAKTADTLQSLPDPGVAASNFAANSSPNEAQGQKIVSGVQTFLSALGRP
jgi:hypothetical protein